MYIKPKLKVLTIFLALMIMATSVTIADAYAADIFKPKIKVTVVADGTQKTCETAEVPVKDFLQTQNITMDEDDKINMSKEQVLKDKQTIVINRIETKELKKTSKIKYKVKKVKDKNLLRGKKKVKVRGVKGKKEKTYSVTYSDGKVIKKEVVKTTVVKKPVTKVVKIGIKKKYKKSFTVKAYAYNDSGITASGRPVGKGIIAVDPNVIPLGSLVYVQGYGNAIAADTGGAIKGRTVDLWMSSNRACNNWGVRYVKCHVLNK